MRPYIIWSPPWDHKVGGIRALRRLRDELRTRGCVAHMNDEVVFDPEAIVVYPEIVQGNPLGATRIVRWRLSPADVPADGLIVDWIDYGACNQVLTVDLIDDPALFARRPGPRSGVAVWVHKGRADLDVIPAGAVLMTSSTPETRAGVADLLGRVEYLISFDEFSTVSLEAILLGTPVLLYPTVRFTRDELMAQHWPKHGVAWRPEDIEQARDRTASAWAWYATEQRRMTASVAEFVHGTQSRWPTSG